MMAESPTKKPELLCSSCMVAFNNKKLYQDHLMTKKHQMVVHRAYVKELKEKHSIFVTGLPNMVKKDVIQKFFFEFGEVVDHFIANNNKFANVQYKDAAVVEELVGKTLVMNGKKIKVERRKIRDTQDLEHETLASDGQLKSVVLQLKDISGFNEQLNKLLKLLKPNQFDSSMMYDCLCRDLQEALQNLFSVCNVYPFGSTVTGLDFFGSDVDAYVNVADYTPLNPNETRASNLVTNSKMHLEKSFKFKNVVAIPKAKTPIVKCLHVPTQINCDFNFKNMLGVCNSYLIKYYINLEAKIKPMMVILKCWGKVHDLVGPSKFSSYSLIILFIFFLQQTYKLPAIEVLQHQNAPVNIQDDWNGGIDPTYRPVLSKLMCARMIDVLAEFFGYFAKLDYPLYVISPFTGSLIPKTVFATPDLLPKTYFLYKQNIKYKEPIRLDKSLCVQDPFEHTHNITRAVNPKWLEEFVQLCKHGSEMLRSSQSLYRLFTEILGDQHFQLAEGVCNFQLKMPNTLDHLVTENQAASSDDLRKAWYESVNVFIMTLLQRVFLTELEVSKEESNGKTIKLDGQSDVYDTKRIDWVKFNCVQRQPTWLRQKNIGKDLSIDKDLDVLERQALITNYITEVLHKGIEFQEPIFEFYIVMSAMVNPTCMAFELGLTSEETKDNAFFQFAKFFVTMVPQWYAQHERKKKTDAEKADGNAEPDPGAEIKIS